MWQDVTSQSRVRVVWQELLERTEAEGPRFKAEVTVLRLDCSKLGQRGGLYVIHRRIEAQDGDEEFEKLLRDHLLSRGQLGPTLSQHDGDDAAVTRWFQHYADEWLTLVSKAALMVSTREDDRT